MINGEIGGIGCPDKKESVTKILSLVTFAFQIIIDVAYNP